MVLFTMASRLHYVWICWALALHTPRPDAHPLRHSGRVSSRGNPARELPRVCGTSGEACWTRCRPIGTVPMVRRRGARDTDAQVCYRNGTNGAKFAPPGAMFVHIVKSTAYRFNPISLSAAKEESGR